MNNDDISEDLLSAVEKALQYDYLQDKWASPSTMAGLVAEHLTLRFANDYLVSRPVVDVLIRDLETANPVILVGENGSGKSAALISLKHRLREARQRAGQDSGSSPLDLIVFNGNANSGQLAKRREMDDKRVYILEKFGEALERRTIEPPNLDRLDWRTFATLYVSAFSAFCTRYRAWTTAPDLDLFLAEDERAYELWWDIFTTWKRHPIIDRLKDMIEFIRWRGSRLAFAIDNCDFLTNADLEAAGEATRDLFSITQTVMPVIVAVRPGTKERARIRMGIKDVKTRYVNSFEKITGASFVPASTEAEVDTPAAWPSPARILLDLVQTYDIFERRLKIFEDPLLVTKLRGLLGPDDGRGDQLPECVRSAIGKLRREAESVLLGYFSFDGRDWNDDDPRPPVERLADASRNVAPRNRPSPESREDLTRIFTMWHNGSVRELATSLFAYIIRNDPEIFGSDATRTALGTSDSDLVAPSDPANRELTEPNPRTYLFRHLMFHGTENQGIRSREFPEIHPCCRLFALTNHDAKEHFRFPSARVLQYLHAQWHGSKIQTVESVRDILKEFNVDNGRVDHVLVGLASARSGYGTGLIRIDNLPLDIDGKAIYQELTPEQEVEILPAGIVLIGRLAYVVEFQYWSAVGEDAARSIVSSALQVPERRLIDPAFFSDPNERLRVALRYLSLVLVPRFKLDHAYLDPTHTIVPKDVARLNRFARFFGFGMGDWHLSRTARQISRYVRTHPDRQQTREAIRRELDEESAALFDVICDSAERLDEVLRMKETAN